MTLLQALILGILQGATEFLPISSSGHLVLVPWLLGWDASNLTFDTTVHLGTIVAVIIYFWKDIWQIVQGVLKTLKDRNMSNPYGKLGWLIAVGSIPAALIGYLFESFFERIFGAPAVVAILLIVTGVILFFSERLSKRNRGIDSLNWKDGLLIGLAQAGAILPGISRSGSTIAAGLALDIKREDAARFSFLLSIPIILGAGLFKLKDVAEVGANSSQATVLLLGFLAAAITGYACIYFLLAWVRAHSLNIFAYYCWAFGGICLALALIRGI